MLMINIDEAQKKGCDVCPVKTINNQFVPFF
jgi:hypothetical protein